MSTNDVFSLDGNRMYEISGNPNSSTYISEYADFSSIISSGTSGNGPLRFTVKTKDGITKEYGNTANSRTLISNEDNQTIGIWRLNKVEDFHGSYMNYNYNTSSGLLSNITYSGNSLEGFEPYNEIIFTYIERKDSNTCFPGYSAKLTDKWLLSEIQIKSENALVKKYQFVYDTSNNVYSCLNEIVESDSAGNELNITKIVWNGKITDVTNHILVEQNNNKVFTGEGCSYAIYNFERKHKPGGPKYDEIIDKSIIFKAPDIATLYGDLNGDSYMDLIKISHNDSIEPHGIDWQIFLFNSVTNNYSAPDSADAIGTIQDTTALTLKQMTIADINGDRKDELFLFIKNTNQGLKIFMPRRL